MRESIGDAELLKVRKKTPRSHQLFWRILEWPVVWSFAIISLSARAKSDDPLRIFWLRASGGVKLEGHETPRSFRELFA